MLFWPARAGNRELRAGGKPGRQGTLPSITPRVYIVAMKTFLVPVDFSAVTDKVIAAAQSFARAFQGQVVLLHVIQPPVIAGGEYALPVEVVNEAVGHMRENALQKLDPLEKSFRQTGIECRVVVVVGAPVPTILSEAGKHSADFVIMGSHGHGRLYDFLVGSTASGVIKQAKCGVVIIPPADK